MSPQLGGPGHAAGRGSGWFGRIVATLITGAVVVVAIMFSLAVLAIAAVAGAVFLGWLWWKTRQVRRQMRDPSGGAAPRPEGDVIEGEVLKGEWKDDQRP